MKIFTKVPDFTGIRASVMFVNGQGDTDDPALIEWFRNNGYVVGDGISVEPEPVTDTDKLETLRNDPTIEFPHFPSMTVDEIRSWAKANGLGFKIKNYQNKDKLIAILTE